MLHSWKVEEDIPLKAIFKWEPLPGECSGQRSPISCHFGQVLISFYSNFWVLFLPISNLQFTWSHFKLISKRLRWIFWVYSCIFTSIKFKMTILKSNCNLLQSLRLWPCILTWRSSYFYQSNLCTKLSLGH